MSDVSDKWFYITCCVLITAVGVFVVADKFKESASKQQLKELQSECVRLGYGEYVDGEFKLKETKD